MGDNIQLGDRNGVRTPMQWTSGPNGGFSTAASEDLYLPAITDPVYGFGAVNVESQRGNPSSLFNWTRRLIDMRKAHRAFGRGNLLFLRPGNRRVLAYLRQFEGESILCVANLSRAPQAVELDLSSFKGRVPVELLGRSIFPPIGQLPYLLTLGGHGFFSFRLADDVAAPAWHEEPPAVQELPVLVLLEEGWHTLLAQPGQGGSVKELTRRRARQRLERQILPRYFRTQAWFVDREATVLKFRFENLQEWSWGGRGWVLATVAVSLADGGVHRYSVPLALAWEREGEDAPALPPSATLAKVRLRAQMGVLFDAALDDRFLRAIVAAVERGDTAPFGHGRLEFKATGAYPGLAGPAESAAIARFVSEHGQLRVNIDGRMWMKGYRWLLEGTHPELELSRFLTETALFPHIPQLAGTVEYVDPEGQRSTLAILERYMENQGDAWTFTLNYLERFLDDLRATPEPPQMRHTAYIEFMNTLGQRTAEFHKALALPDEAGAFGNERISVADMADWVAKVRRGLDMMFELLARDLPGLPEPAQSMGAGLLAARPKLLWLVLKTVRMPVEAVKTRYHGDYSLGQVWLVKNDCLIANYGGEPGLPWAERRRKHTPLRDLASMLISLDEAGAAALDVHDGETPELRALLSRHVDDWHRLARRALFRSYRKAMAGHPSCPASAAEARALVTLCLAEMGAAGVTSAMGSHAASIGSAIRRMALLAQRGR